ALENHNGAVRDSPPGKVVDKEVDAHSWRHAENSRQTQRHTVTLLKNRLLGFDLGYAIKRDGPERCLFGAELSGFANAIARVGRWIDDNLRLGDTLCQRNDGIPVHSPGGDRIFIAQGSANKCGKGYHDVDSRNQLVQNALVARVTAYRIEPGVAATKG